MLDAVPQGELIKLAIVYDRAFWRGQGLTGSAVGTDGFVSFTLDDSPADGQPGVMVAFVGGDKAIEFARLSRSAARGRAAEMVEFFGGRPPPRQYVETNWPEERWSRGAPVGIYSPGVLSRLGPAIRKPARTRPLGRHGDVDLLERLHGRRRALGRAGRGEVLDRL